MEETERKGEKKRMEKSREADIGEERAKEERKRRKTAENRDDGRVGKAERNGRKRRGRTEWRRVAKRG